MIEIPLDVCGHSLIHSRFEIEEKKREEEGGGEGIGRRLRIFP